MKHTINSLLIPVENQVRELDPKLLLACFAARTGFISVIGSRREMELSIDSFPPSIAFTRKRPTNCVNAMGILSSSTRTSITSTPSDRT
jgi:hypothetical protein